MEYIFVLKFVRFIYLIFNIIVWGIVMPVFKMKKVWDYATYNKPFFIFILFLLCIWVLIDDYTETIDSLEVILLLIVLNSLLFGYGMTVTRDRINNGKRLPKIMLKDVLILGFKSFIVFGVYFGLQGFILKIISSPLGFPPFDLEDMLMDAPETVQLLISHSPVDVLMFLFLGSVLFYITVFFMEIALGRLADTGELKSAFDLFGIKRDIDTIGWLEYAKDYTLILLAIVIFSYLNIIVIPNDILNYIWGVLLYLLVLITQFLGIGAVYNIVKEKEKEKSESSQAEQS